MTITATRTQILATTLGRAPNIAILLRDGRFCCIFIGDRKKCHIFRGDRRFRAIVIGTRRSRTITLARAQIKANVLRDRRFRAI